MTDNIMAICTGRLTLSRISYHTNLQQASGLVIPLGVIAEMTLGPWRALGLIARSKLSSDELSATARMLRDKLAVPFGLLKPEFDWAFANTEPNEALAKLSERFSESLFFAPPSHQAMKKLLPEGPTAAEQILSDLRRSRDEEFYLMLAEAGGGRNVPPTEDITRLAA